MCGIVGIYTPGRPHAPELASLALFAQQHRGQESCGIAWSDQNRLRLHRSMGLVKEVFTPEQLSRMKSSLAIGHVRYPTQGGSNLENAQPHLVETLAGPRYALASNGDLINYPRVRDELLAKGVHLSTNNDGEAITRLLVYLLEREGLSPVSAIQSLFSQLEGAFSTVFLTPEEMIVFRDPYGFRPMSFGEIESGWAVTSESCALDVLRATNIREIEPGEIVVFRPTGVETIHCDVRFFRSAQRQGTAHCVFELIYFARPDSHQFGKQVYDIRRRIGRALAGYDDFTPDCVIPVPDSSNFIAQGYAEASGAPFEMGLIRNHYVGRTFIKPVQSFRDESVKQKFNPLAGFFPGKRVMLVDDSIVRGTTLRKLVRMIQGAGAREVHVRIGSPPVCFPCFYGIDTPTCEELIANQMSLEEIRVHLQADSLKYLKIEDLKSIVANGRLFCAACFDGAYPVGTPIPGKKSTTC
jgi:amidophosphoribosyltransferase